MQKSVVGCALVARWRNCFASSTVYGCGNKSRRPSQIRRLFACLASDSTSSSRHGRTVQRSSKSCTCLFSVESDSSFLHFAVRQKPDQRFVVKIVNLTPVAPRIVKIAADRRLNAYLVFAS